MFAKLELTVTMSTNCFRNFWLLEVSVRSQSQECGQIFKQIHFKSSLNYFFKWFSQSEKVTIHNNSSQNCQIRCIISSFYQSLSFLPSLRVELREISSLRSETPIQSRRTPGIDADTLDYHKIGGGVSIGTMRFYDNISPHISTTKAPTNHKTECFMGDGARRRRFLA